MRFIRSRRGIVPGGDSYIYTTTDPAEVGPLHSRTQLATIRRCSSMTAVPRVCVQWNRMFAGVEQGFD